MSYLERYSKERRAGDQTSGGRGKLLKPTAELSSLELVVRETLQNSWDARLPDWHPAYGIRVYKLPEEVRDTLREVVFKDLPEDALTYLAMALSRDDLHVLEIFDRGTSGLTGPTNATEAPKDKNQNHFNSLVFDIGSTTGPSDSGGTYGFGKTAAFDISNAHTVIYWSACENEYGEVENRYIANSLGEHYEEAGKRFTGAHWWGQSSEEAEILPIRGDYAKKLGEETFRTPFGVVENDSGESEPETGTSILILDPVLVKDIGEDTAKQQSSVKSDADAKELIAQIQTAMAKHAWPKAVRMDNAEHPPLILEMYFNREKKDITDQILRNFEPYAYSLVKVRQAQGQQTEEFDNFNIAVLDEPEVIPITLRLRNTSQEEKQKYFGDRNDQVVGHLHLMKCVEREVENERGRIKNRVCFMRSKAELVVFYGEDKEELEDQGVEWYGVFKPTPEADHHFAQAEPPTHDAWSPNTAQNEISHYVVSNALKGVRRHVQRFLQPKTSGKNPAELSTRRVAKALQDFMPLGLSPLAETIASVTNERTRTNSLRKTKTAKPTVSIIGQQPLPDGRGYSLDIVVRHPEEKLVRTEVKLFAKTATDSMLLEQEEYVLEWGLDAGDFSQNTATFLTGREVNLVVKTLQPKTLEIKFLLDWVLS